jgi:hypothetical protein
MKKSTNKMSPLSFCSGCRQIRNIAGIGFAQPGIGDTGIPFTRNCVLETTTWSPAFRPEMIE